MKMSVKILLGLVTLSSASQLHAHNLLVEESDIPDNILA